MYGYVYITTNTINNKIYIGQHKSKKFNPLYKGSGVVIRRAFKEYGKENFTVELLEECETREDLNEREIYYIDLYDARNIEIGYNLSVGGHERFFTGMKHSDETRKKMSEAAKKREHPPTTAGRICITNGKENHMIRKEDLSMWEENGFTVGKTTSGKPAWNKGLTKEDPRVAKYADKLKEIIKNGGSVGCYGVKGNQYGFKKGQPSINKGKKGLNKGHPNYYFGKKKKDVN